MSTLSIRLPASLHKELKKLSKMDQISINQFVMTAISEKITALETATFLAERAKKGTLDDFRKVIEKVPDVPADSEDVE